MTWELEKIKAETTEAAETVSDGIARSDKNLVNDVPQTNIDNLDSKVSEQEKIDAERIRELRNVFAGDNSLSPFRPGAIGRKIGEGSHADIYEAGSSPETKKDFVVKIGKTQEYSPPILKALRLSFSRKKLSGTLEKVLGPQFKIYPDMDFIKNGVAEQLLMKQYFGREDAAKERGNSQNKKEKNGADVGEETRGQLFGDLQNPDSEFFQEIVKTLGNNSELIKQLTDCTAKHQMDNFMPRETVIVGHPPEVTQDMVNEFTKSGKKLPSTYYIVQERIKGENVVPLNELSDDELKNDTELIEKLLMFTILTKKMYFDTGKLIDTRPEEVGKNPLEWFQKTANIMVDKDTKRVAFVDTRWLWDKSSALGKGGVNLVDNLGVRSVDRAMKKYSDFLLSAKKAAQKEKQIYTEAI